MSSNMMRLSWLATGFLVACGGSGEAGDPGSSEAALAAWGLEGVETDSDSGSVTGSVRGADCDTVIVFALDKVLQAELPVGPGFPGARAVVTPRLGSVLAGAMAVPDAIATSTAGNAAVASLLTGRHVTEHGIVSLRDPARQTLPMSEATLAEGFQRLGWTTIFSSGSPLHARGFAGFAQGFDHFEAPRLAEKARPAAAVANGALLPLRAALTANQPVFAFVSFDDLTARSLRTPSPEVAARFVRARLSPLAANRADIEAALRTLDASPAKGLEELERALGRARGSRASAAWNMGLRDAYLSLIDEAVGEVLDAVEAAGRADRALVVVTGLRGTLPPGYRHESGALFTKHAVQLPMAIRWPGGLRRSESVTETASLLDLPHALDDEFMLGLGTTAYRAANVGLSPGAGVLPGAACVVDSQRQLFAAIDGAWQVERYSDGRLVTFDREGNQSKEVDAASAARLESAVQAFAGEATSVGMTLDLLGPGDAPTFELAWETGGGAVPPAGGGRPTVRGKIDFPTSEVALAFTERATAVRMRLRAVGGATSSTVGPALGPALGPDGVRLGSPEASLPVAELPLLYAPLDEVKPKDLPEGAPPARLRFERADGLAWTLSVDPPAGSKKSEAGSSAPVETEVLLSVWPPREFTDALEVQAGGGTRSEPVPGRLDMVRIFGVAPLVCRVKKLAKEDFLVACKTPEGFLLPTEMEYHGLRFADPSAFEFVVPFWQPKASAALPSPDEAIYGVLDSGASTEPDPTEPALLIHRFEFGPMSTEFTPPDASDALELVRLVPGE